MKLSRRECGAIVLAGIASPFLVSAARADTIEIKMLNFDATDPTRVMIYDPEIARIQPGDAVRWLSVDTLHNSASIDGMIPEGATPWSSPISEDFEMTFDVEGTYGYLCEPHAMVGMAGLVLVGDHTVNLEAARSVRHEGMLQAKFDELFAQIT